MRWYNCRKEENAEEVEKEPEGENEEVIYTEGENEEVIYKKKNKVISW
jgi:hypothetical protein